MKFGIHAGPQDCSIDDLRRLWRFADERGFAWCSVWDHLFSVSEPTNPAKPAFEGIASMAGLACVTARVRVGCLVFAVPYRPLGVLAKAATTIDHLSGGRCELGLGIGWNAIEFQAWNLPLGSIPERLDQLEETAIVLRRLFDGERVTFRGRQVQVDDALCDPRPVQERLRLWIGGQGEKRLLRIVARHADGWNVAFVSPEVYAQKSAVLERWCERDRRRSQPVLRSVNVGLAIGADEIAVRRQEESLRLMFGTLVDFVRPGIMVGTPAQVIDRIGDYQRAGVEWLILACRAPFDWDGLDLFVRAVMPAFA